MNKWHQCLKFISEAEYVDTFSFLDITCHKQQFKTSVKRKPIFSIVFTKYESYLDQSYKKSLTDTLLFHCFFFICSDYTLLHLEVENFIIKKNSYHSGITEQSIKYFLNKLCSEKSNSNCS